MRKILALAEKSDPLISALRTPLLRAGIELVVESDLDSLTIEVACDSDEIACRLMHLGVEVCRDTHALVLNRLSPYHSRRQTAFEQSELAAAIWAALALLSVPVSNRPSDCGLFPGADASYIARQIWGLGWEFSNLFGSIVSGPNGQIDPGQYAQFGVALEESFAFFLVGVHVVPVFDSCHGLAIYEDATRLALKLGSIGITFALVVIGRKQDRPTILELNPWPPEFLIKKCAEPIARAMVEQYP